MAHVDTIPTSLSDAEYIVLRQTWQIQGGPVMYQEEWERLGGLQCAAALDVCAVSIREKLVRRGLLQHGLKASYDLTKGGLILVSRRYQEMQQFQPLRQNPRF